MLTAGMTEARRSRFASKCYEHLPLTANAVLPRCADDSVYNKGKFPQGVTK